MNDVMPYTEEQKRRIRANLGLESVEDLIRDLDGALRAHTFKGLVGPLAYQVMKGITK